MGYGITKQNVTDQVILVHTSVIKLDSNPQNTFEMSMIYNDMQYN